MTHPAIRELFQALGRNAAFQDLVRKLPQGGHYSLSGLTDTAKALHLILLGQLTGRQIFMVTDGAKQAELLAELCQTFFDLLVTAREFGDPILIPALDVLPFQGLSPHSEISEQRAVGLIRLATGRAPLVIAPIGAALLRTDPPSSYRQLTLSLRVGEEIAQEDMVGHLLSIGYERREPVEMVGEFSVRGGIVQVALFGRREGCLRSGVRGNGIRGVLLIVRVSLTEKRLSQHRGRCDERGIVPRVEHRRCARRTRSG